MLDYITTPETGLGDERCGHPGVTTEPAQPILLALCSRAMGSGKSTVAEHLVNRHGFVRLRFAGPLKAMTSTLLAELGEPEEMIERRVEGDLKEAEVPTLRRSCRYVMQRLGTEFGRDCLHRDVWAQITAARATAILQSGKSVVIDDMRFNNELGAVLDAGGYAWRIERSSAQVTSSHASEGELDGEMLLTIVNDGTVDELLTMVDTVLAGQLRMRYSLNSGFPRL